MNKIKISWLSFTIITAFYITALNYNFFKYIYDNIEQSDLIITTSIIIAYFLSSLIIFSMLFIKGLTKFISILCISVTCIGSYFIYKYSIFLDYSVIGNVFRTNVAEAKSFIDINLMLYLIFALIIPSILILLCKIDYKNHFYIKLRLLLISLLGICMCILPFKHTIQSFYNDNVQIKFLTLPFYTIYQGYKFVKLELKKPPRTHIGLDASISLDQDGKLLIFIAGESARAANYSIGGGGGTSLMTRTFILSNSQT
ncbi:phosphoethanolamine transferase domain-containing protein [Campylobacter sp. 9BO]|uniref:phosphoethanolamine transferase domain-containing protein n=1 Tax=Campylobacter sp. 9BO TaxID=3424759 RepID=UPI003D34B9E1